MQNSDANTQFPRSTWWDSGEINPKQFMSNLKLSVTLASFLVKSALLAQFFFSREDVQCQNSRTLKIWRKTVEGKRERKNTKVLWRNVHIKRWATRNAHDGWFEGKQNFAYFSFLPKRDKTEEINNWGRSWLMTETRVTSSTCAYTLFLFVFWNISEVEIKMYIRTNPPWCDHRVGERESKRERTP